MSPCYNCPKRYKCCHTNCMSYAEFRARVGAQKEAERLEHIITSTTIHQYKQNGGYYKRIRPAT